MATAVRAATAATYRGRLLSLHGGRRRCCHSAPRGGEGPTLWGSARGRTKVGRRDDTHAADGTAITAANGRARESHAIGDQCRGALRRASSQSQALPRGCSAAPHPAASRRVARAGQTECIQTAELVCPFRCRSSSLNHLQYSLVSASPTLCGDGSPPAPSPTSGERRSAAAATAPAPPPRPCRCATSRMGLAPPSAPSTRRRCPPSEDTACAGRTLQITGVVFRFFTQKEGPPQPSVDGAARPRAPL